MTGRKGDRAENVRRLLEIRAAEPDLDARDLGVRVGLSYSTVQTYLRDPTGEKTAARRMGYGGRCEGCGARTSGQGPSKRFARCRKCGQTGRPKVWSKERIIEAIQAWVLTYGETPAFADWSATAARRRGYPEKLARWRRLNEQDLVPAAMTVVYEFGTWNAGIRAAGYEPNPWGKTRTPRRPKARCIHNHELTEENVYVDPQGWRHCRVCRAGRADRYAAARQGILI